MKEITITGKALNARAGAVIVDTDKETYYIHELEAWPDHLLQKKLKVTGLLRIENTEPESLIDEFGARKPGIPGKRNVIVNASWKEE